MATTFLEEIKKHKKDYPEYWGLKEEQFNVFTALRPISDEVYLHSRFISTMLDPNGLHNLGITPLKKFLEIIGCKKEYIEHISKESTTVTPNSKNWTEECEIDILIENNDKDKKFAIIIENKIFASDSNHIEKDESDNAPKNNEGQLARYYRYITTGITPNEKRKRTITYNSNQVEIYYLTLDQHKPSKISLGSQLSVKGDKKEGTKEVNLIDYKKEICEWIETLLKDAIEPNLRGAITQYQQVVKKLVGDIELNKEISHLVSRYYNDIKNDNVNLKEILINEKVNHLIDVHWHAIASFMDNLGNELQQLKIEVEGRSSHLAITDLLYHPNKHTPIYFRIKQNGIVWTLQVDDRCREKGFFLGIDKETEPNKDNASEIQNLLSKIGNVTPIEGWHIVKYLHECTIEFEGKEMTLPLLNLWDFTQGDTFDLLNEEERKNIAQQYAKFVKQEFNNLNSK